MINNLTTAWTTKSNMVDLYTNSNKSDLCYDSITKIVYIKSYIFTSCHVPDYSYCNYIGPTGRFCKYDEVTSTIYEI